MTITEVAPAGVLTDPEPETEEPAIAHIIRKEDSFRGYIGREPVLALCGKLWVPTRSIQGLPVCEQCQEVLDQILDLRSKGS